MFADRDFSEVHQVIIITHHPDMAPMMEIKLLLCRILGAEHSSARSDSSGQNKRR